MRERGGARGHAEQHSTMRVHGTFDLFKEPMKRTHLSLYQQATKHGGNVSDGRRKAHHQRYARSFVCVTMGTHTIKYWPLKSCPNICGVTQMTLRTWIKHHIINLEKMHRMWVMTRAEMHAIGRAVKKHRAGTTRHNQLSEAFLEDLASNLAAVRYALSKLQKRTQLTEEELRIMQPSLQGK